MKRIVPAISTIATLALLALIWLYVLPPQLGGRTTLLTTSGISMEPLLHSGDVAVLRKQSTYRVGDVIQYHSETLNAPLLHRIVSVDGQGITTKGDNNNFLDLDHPTDAQVTGKMVHHFTGAGKFVRILKSMPVRILGALLLGFAAYNILTGSKDGEGDEGDRRRSLRRNRRRVAPPASGESPPSAPPPPSSGEDSPSEPDGQPVSGTRRLAAGFAALGAASLIIGTIAFTQPMTTLITAPTIYNFQGKFGYSANAPGAELIYADGQVQTGDPIFLSVVKDLFVTYNVSVDSPAKFKGGGDVEMKATLKGSSGWSHVIPLSGTVHFNGTQGRATAVLDLPHMVDLVHQAQSITKIPENSFTISIQPTVSIDGVLGGSKLDTKFSSNLDLTGTTTQLKAQNGSGDQPESPTGSKTKKNETTNGVSTSGSGTLMVHKGTPARIHFGPVGTSVAMLRVLSILGFVLSVAGLAYVAVLRRLRPKVVHADDADVLAQALAAYNEMLHDGAGAVVDVLSMAEIAGLASKHNLTATEDAAGYSVEYEGVRYIYRRTETDAATRFGVSGEQTETSTDASTPSGDGAN